MDLKDFIKETISSISEATAELQVSLGSLGVILNPPVDAEDGNVYRAGSKHTYSRIQTIEFDVAVTASADTSGGAKGGLKVLSFEFGAEGTHSRQSEQVSRVKFGIPLVLPPSSAIEGNALAAEAVRKQGFYAG